MVQTEQTRQKRFLQKPFVRRSTSEVRYRNWNMFCSSYITQQEYWGYITLENLQKAEPFIRNGLMFKN